MEIEERRERQRQANRRFRKAHPDRIRAGHHKWKQANPDKIKVYRDRNNAKRRQKLIALFGGKCAICGYDKDWRAFQIDHINGGGTKEIRSFNSTLAYYRHILDCNGKGYQLLCANCNQIKRFENKEDGKKDSK